LLTKLEENEPELASSQEDEVSETIESDESKNVNFFQSDAYKRCKPINRPFRNEEI